jgi:hypothetical protein
MLDFDCAGFVKAQKALRQHQAMRANFGRKCLSDSHPYWRRHSLSWREQILKKRVEGRGEQLNELSDARLEDFETLNQSYEAPLELEAHNLVTVGTDSPLETTVAQTFFSVL